MHNQSASALSELFSALIKVKVSLKINRETPLRLYPSLRSETCKMHVLYNCFHLEFMCLYKEVVF